MSTAVDALKIKLAESASFHSFRSESAVCDALKSLRWNAKHGAYYEDLETKKQREIDVIAQQFWSRKTKNGDQRVRITVLIEVKTMKGFHLLVSPFEEDGFSFYQNVHWLGDPLGNYSELSSALKVGSSDFPVGDLSRIQIKPAAVEIDGDLEVVTVPESTGTFLYSCNL